MTKYLRGKNLNDGEVLYNEAMTTTESKKKFADIWLINLGATWHMTSRRKWFHQYEPISKGVYMGDNHALKIVDIGTIKIKMYDGIICTIQRVQHVVGLKKNLLSVGQLDDFGCKTCIKKRVLKIIKRALVVLKAEKIVGNLYMLKGETH